MISFISVTRGSRQSVKAVATVVRHTSWRSVRLCRPAYHCLAAYVECGYLQFDVGRSQSEYNLPPLFSGTVGPFPPSSTELR